MKGAFPPCQVACPLHTDIRGYIAAIARLEFDKAYAIAREPNPLIHVCSRVCTHPCEEKCRRGEVDEPVAIWALKRFVADVVRGKRRFATRNSQFATRVAIVGSGPCGLAAAHDLARMGYQVTIFEAHSEPGGMLTIGIPRYRLPREVIEVDIKQILDLGVELKTNTPIGEEITLSDLKERGYDAIFISTGAHKSRRLGIEGEALAFFGVEFLREINLGRPVEIGRRVLVIGGGNVAIDSARSALRLGAEEVKIIYRRSRAEMPAGEEEVEEAESEGVEFHFLATPTKIISEDGKVVGMECIRMRLGPPDESGRRRPIPIEGSEFTIEGDTIIIAIGQTPDLSFIRPEDGIEITTRGTIAVDPITLATSAQGIFAGGDVITGPGSVVEAISFGKKAAISIDAYLRGETPSFEEPVELEALSQKTLARIKRIGREEVPKLQKPLGFEEVKLGYSVGMAVRASHRCLTCGAGAIIESEKCASCLTCVRVCPYEVPIVNGKGAVIDASQCQACGICACECPSKAITIGFDGFEAILARIEALFEDSPKANPEPLIVGFCCLYCAYADGVDVEKVRSQLPANVKIIDVLCTGKVDSLFLLKAFELGADGVFVAGCLEGDCHNISGNIWARKRVEHVKEILDEIGLSGERLQMYNIPSSEWWKVIEIAKEMVESGKISKR